MSDVTGDGVPELLFVEKSPYSEEYVEYDALNIFTVENGAAKQIYYADHWETQVAGGNVYSLFQVDGESSLYLCNGMQDESTFEDYCRYVVQPDGTLQEESLMSRKREPNEDYSVFLLPVVSTKYFLPSTQHISSLFLNVPNLRFTKSIQPWYSQLVVENRCSGVVR